MKTDEIKKDILKKRKKNSCELDLFEVILIKKNEKKINLEFSLLFSEAEKKGWGKNEFVETMEYFIAKGILKKRFILIDDNENIDDLDDSDAMDALDKGYIYHPVDGKIVENASEKIGVYFKVCIDE